MLNARKINRGAINRSTILSQCNAGVLASIEQSVALQQTVDAGALISITQSVISECNAGSIINLQQQVSSASQLTFLERNGWYPIIIINNIRVQDNKIRDFIVTKTESSTAQLSCEFLAGTGVIDLDYYIGKSITVDVVKPDGSANRVFTGKINLPELDIIDGYLYLQCSDMREERIESELADLLPSIGYYSEDLFGSGTGSVADEMTDRMSTIPYSLDYSNYGNVIIHGLLAGTPHYTLYSSDVYRDDGQDPVVQKAIRSKIVNTVNISIAHQYVRTYHRTRTFQWDANYGSTCEFLRGGYDVAKREMIAAAVQAAGWPVHGSISYTPCLPSGVYRCSGYNLIWGTSKQEGTYTPVINSLTGKAQVDSSGNPVYGFVATSQTNYANVLCFGASWNATTRFAQNLQENYTLTVTAPQSVNQFGVVDEDMSIGVSSTYDATDWENYKTYSAPPTNVVRIGSSTNYYINRDVNLSGFNDALNAALNKAKVTILKAHREDKVIFNTVIFPELDVYHTIQLDTNRVDCIGKVYSYTHTCNVTNGDAKTKVELALSRSVGSQSDSALSIPERPAYNPTQTGASVNLQSHYGQAPQSGWNGFIANKWITVNTGGQSTNKLKTAYPVQFIVDTPNIEDAVRSNVQLYTTATYNVSIPNNSLTITII